MKGIILEYSWNNRLQLYDISIISISNVPAGMNIQNLFVPIESEDLYRNYIIKIGRKYYTNKLPLYCYIDSYEINRNKKTTEQI